MIETPDETKKEIFMKRIREHYKWLKLTPERDGYKLRWVLENTISDWNISRKLYNLISSQVLENTISDWNRRWKDDDNFREVGIREHYKWLKLRYLFFILLDVVEY